LKNSRHGANRVPQLSAGTRKQWQNEMRRVQLGLSNHPSQNGGLPQTPRAQSRELRQAKRTHKVQLTNADARCEARTPAFPEFAFSFPRHCGYY
jgi:hypothetical protein